MTQNGNSKSPFHGLWALTNRELKKLYKNPFLLFMTIIQPLIWLGLFGKAMNLSQIFTGNKISLTNQELPAGTPALTTQQLQGVNGFLSGLGPGLLQKTFGTSSYFSFMSVGMVSFIVLFTCMFSGMSIVWDRRLGILNKLLSTPVARGSILMSKVLNSVIRSLLQAAIVLGVAFALGLTPGPDFSPVFLLGVFAAVFLLCMGLSSIFILIAIRSTNWQTQMAIMNLLNLPLLFASNALFPTSIMPSWLQTVANVNPVSYATDASRTFILDPINMSKLATDFGVLGVFAVVFSTIGIVLSWRYLSR
ncbi:MAG TPA: ABC transporter permease [Candidatus Bathyarchaeia archaeon]|nr:ABC transporter permease [Candidatus Bathyarchaeia archaeon]